MTELFDVMLAKWFRLVRLSHHLHLADAYSTKVDQYLELRRYLKELHKHTPHDNIKQEIEDVLSTTNH